MLEKCVLTILELSWNLRLGNKKTKLNICHHVLTSSTQLQNRSFHVVERTRASSKYQKMKSARAKRAKILFFIVKYANLWGFCCRRRRGCLSSLVSYSRSLTGASVDWKQKWWNLLSCLSFPPHSFLFYASSSPTMKIRSWPVKRASFHSWWSGSLHGDLCTQFDNELGNINISLRPISDFHSFAIGPLLSLIHIWRCRRS